MKKFFLFFTLIFVATICGAQIKLQANKEGVYRLKTDSLEWVDSEITAQSEALRYVEKFTEAISKPQQRILVERSENILKLKFLFKAEMVCKESFIIYNNHTKNIDYVDGVPIKKEESSYLILFSVGTILLMVASNLLHEKKKGFSVIFAAFATACMTGVLFDFCISNAFAFLAAVGAAVAAAVACAVAYFSDDESVSVLYKLASVAFYICVTIYIIVIFR